MGIKINPKLRFAQFKLEKWHVSESGARNWDWIYLLKMLICYGCVSIFYAYYYVV